MWPGLGTGVERWKVVVVVRRQPDPYVLERERGGGGALACSCRPHSTPPLLPSLLIPSLCCSSPPFPAPLSHSLASRPHLMALSSPCFYLLLPLSLMPVVASPFVFMLHRSPSAFARERAVGWVPRSSCTRMSCPHAPLPTLPFTSHFFACPPVCLAPPCPCRSLFGPPAHFMPSLSPHGLLAHLPSCSSIFCGD
jgi:hypothetical protein